MRRLLATVSALALGLASAGAQTWQTPGENQQQINGLPWNGQKMLTGAQLQSLFTNINGTFHLYGALNGNQTWSGANTFTGATTVPGATIGNTPFLATGNGATTSASDATRWGQVFNPVTDYLNPATGRACVWNSTGDVGPCIQAAINAAGAAGGGLVPIPASMAVLGQCFGVKTAITQPFSGVSLLGAGVGNLRDTFAPGTFQAITRLCWTGATGATMFTEAPTGSQLISSSNVEGITFDCNDIAAICAKFATVRHSMIRVGVSEPTSVGFECITIHPFSDSEDMQDNDIWVWARSTLSDNSPTGVLLDSAAGSSGNCSANRFHLIRSWFNKGDGIVFGNADNNIVTDFATYPQPGASGRSSVFANSLYVPPNGVPVNGYAYSNVILHNDTFANPLGYRTGASFAAGANSCNGAGASACGPTTVSVTTTAGGNAYGNKISLSATTGVQPYETINCMGGTSSGVEPDSTVSQVGSNYVYLINSSLVSSIADGVSCLVSWGATMIAAPGLYTITATGASTVNITAPAAGHSQTGVTVSGGTLSATDLIVPWTGTMTAGDSWTVILAQPSKNIKIENTDSDNSIPDPNLQFGNNVTFGRTGQPYDLSWITSATQGVVIGIGSASGNCITMSLANGSGCFGGYSMNLSGIGSNVNGFGALVTGHNNLSGGSYGFVEGEGNTGTGFVSKVSGEGGNDGNRYNAQVQGGGTPNGQGSAQATKTVLWGAGSSASAIRLTGDGNAAGAANCFNIPNAAGYSLVVSVTAFDKTTVTKNETWQNWGMLLTRGANAASTALVTASTPAPLTNGTLTGSGIAASADTTNGCLNLSFTPPSGNTDTWDVAAKIESAEAR